MRERASNSSGFVYKVGDRVSVITDEGFLVGTGKVTYIAERTEVIFDNGSGGMFPNRFIRPELTNE
jgi:hypothetical protein